MQAWQLETVRKICRNPFIYSNMRSRVDLSNVGNAGSSAPCTGGGLLTTGCMESGFGPHGFPNTRQAARVSRPTNDAVSGCPTPLGYKRLKWFLRLPSNDGEGRLPWSLGPANEVAWASCPWTTGWKPVPPRWGSRGIEFSPRVVRHSHRRQGTCAISVGAVFEEAVQFGRRSRESPSGLSRYSCAAAKADAPRRPDFDRLESRRYCLPSSSDAGKNTPLILPKKGGQSGLSKHTNLFGLP